MGGLYMCESIVENRDHRMGEGDGATPEIWGGSPERRMHVSRGVGEEVDKLPKACYHRLWATFEAGSAMNSAVK